MTRKNIKAAVAEALRDFPMRQAARESARQVQCLLAARRSGRLSRIEHAMQYLKVNGIRFDSTEVYRLTTIRAAGVHLYFRPDGALDNPSICRRAPAAEASPLFT